MVPADVVNALMVLQLLIKRERTTAELCFELQLTNWKTGRHKITQVINYLCGFGFLIYEKDSTDQNIRYGLLQSPKHPRLARKLINRVRIIQRRPCVKEA